jgi:hypothetical protein
MRNRKSKKLIDVAACGLLSKSENSSVLLETSCTQLGHVLAALAISRDWLIWLKWSLKHLMRQSGLACAIERTDLVGLEMFSPSYVPFLHLSLPIPHRQFLCCKILSASPRPTRRRGKGARHERQSLEVTYVRNRSLGTSLESLGASLGFSNCCVLDGRDIYGRS